MKQFEYVIKDELGIHARPAGLLVKEAGKFNATITLLKDGKSAEAKRLFAVMGLGVKNGDTIIVAVEGNEEEAAFDSIKLFFEANL